MYAYVEVLKVFDSACMYMLALTSCVTSRLKVDV